ncbi:MAG: hypothetical protein PVI15_07715 [Chromatiales bacterium]|jgi:hypothetical protein
MRADWLQSVALGGVAASLTALVAWQILEPPSLDDYRSPSTEDSAQTEVAPTIDAVGRFPPKNVFEEIVQRPLFRNDRRPYEPEPVVSAAAPDPTLNYLTLTGIINSPDVALALFLDRRSNKVLRVEPGGDVGGWEVTEVDRYTVRLRRGAEERELMLLEPEKRPEPKSRGKPDAQSRTAAPSIGVSNDGRERS